MKDRFEEFVKSKREEFDIHSPDPDTWRIIEARRKKKINKPNIWRIISKVAAVFVIFLLSWTFHELRDNWKESKTAENFNEQVYDLAPELKEAEFYYTTQVNLKLKELEPLFTDSPEIKDEVKKDLSELDSIYSSLKQDLKDNIANDQVLEAMIQNYRLKLDILEDLLMDVNNEKKNEKYDNNKKRT
jgi:hypothetical protein